VLANDPTPENLLEALRNGPYGRCVYHCDNDVVDHQVVSMEFTGGLSVTLGMHGHSHSEYRTTRIEGTRGRLLAEFGLGGSWIQVDEHRSDRRTRYNTSASAGSGHGGGDFELMAAFIESIRRGNAGAARTTAEQALESHLMAFAAEQARLEGRVVSLV
jgi:predicted dehydrogenase